MHLMETLPILHDWLSYLNTKPLEIYYNAQKILDQVESRYDSIQVVGRGYSGAQLVSAIQMIHRLRLERGDSQMEIKGILLRKDEEKGSSTSVVFNRSPLVIIDDDICTGRTLKAIAHQLGYLRMNSELVNAVEVVIAMENRFGEEELCQQLIVDAFPNCKLWIR